MATDKKREKEDNKGLSCAKLRANRDFFYAYCPKVVMGMTHPRVHADVVRFRSMAMKLSRAQILMRKSWTCSWRILDLNMNCLTHEFISERLLC